MNQNLYLTGFMGAGKSSAGQGLARLLKRRFVDLDDLVARRLGMDIPQAFASLGEPAFRAAESAELRKVSQRQRLVVATGGGLPVDPANRRLMRGTGRVICLDSSLLGCRARLGSEGTAGRPLWQDPAALEALYASRRQAYADCHAALAVDGLDPAQVVEALAAAVLGRERFSASLGGQECPIEATCHAPQALAPLAAGRRVALITDRNLARLHLDRYLAALGQPLVIEILPGEGSKTLRQAQRLYQALLAGRIERGDLLLALGGGVVSDLAAFVASTYKRGMEFAIASTSLVGAVDAAIGGKTGVNLPAGKNVVGTFAQPALVALDLLALATLPRAQIAEGLVEAYKTGLVSSPELYELVRGNLPALLAGDLPLLARTASLSGRAKAKVVSADYREKGLRRILNLGHTYGHALESFHRYRLSHGRAVAVGLLVAAALSAGRGLIPGELAREVAGDMARLLPRMPAWPEAQVAWEIMQNDKKNQGGRVLFVLLEGVGNPVCVEDVTPAELATALQMARDYLHG
ncbi:MAG: bifunctional shikimate kinase/3-dehydroquinate synthase [Desulfarculus sp.]|nr:bifunctional shikimate kinase/3-dehydroquinate synthase [Desulfarculus sp.]